MWPEEDDCELDDEFLKRMNETLERRDADEQGWQAPQAASANGNANRWLRISSGDLVKYLWYIWGIWNQVDLFGGLQEDPTNVHYHHWKHHEDYDLRFTRDPYLFWPAISLPLWALSTLQLLTSLVFQYYYDYFFVRQQVFRAITSNSNTMDVSSMLKAFQDSPLVRAILAAPATLPEEESNLLMLNDSTLAGGGAGGNATSMTSNLMYLDQLHRQHRSEFGDQFPPRDILTGQLMQVSRRQLGLYLDERVAEARGYLKIVGSPYIVMNFVIEIIYWFLVSAAFVLVICLRFYYRYVTPFNYTLVRSFMDYKHERRLFNYLIRNEINRFFLSSRNFTLACVEQSKSFARTRFIYKSDFEQACAKAEANKFLLDHALTKKQLENMALSGILQPEHRTATWIERLSLLIMTFSIITMVYIFLAAIFFAFVFFAIYEYFDIETTSLIDYLVIFEAGVLIALLTPCGIFNISIMLATCIDQIYYCTSVCKQIRECIALNDWRFREIKALQERQQVAQMFSQQRSRRMSTVMAIGLPAAMASRQQNQQLRQKPVKGGSFSLSPNNFNPHYHQSSTSLNYAKFIDDSRRAIFEAPGRLISTSRDSPERGVADAKVGGSSPDLSRASRSERRYTRLYKKRRRTNAMLATRGQVVDSSQHQQADATDDDWLITGEDAGALLELFRDDLREQTLAEESTGEEFARSESVSSSSVDSAATTTTTSTTLASSTRPRKQQAERKRAVPWNHSSLNQSLTIESCYTQMNADLLRVFITYKIFVAQMRDITRSFVTFTLACLTLMVVAPLQIRIHSPYFTNRTIKLVAVGFSLLGTTAVDFCLILLCFMFARCISIYKCLSSLLAHAVEVMNHSPGSQFALANSNLNAKEQESLYGETLASLVVAKQAAASLGQQQQIYDTHTIWLLRKELNFPDRVIGQFAIVAFDFRLTYSNLLKIHFWVGLLSLSIVVDASSSQEFFGRLFYDPFSIFDWP